MEEKLKSLKAMSAKLISMVAGIRKDIDNMKVDQNIMKEDLSLLRTEQISIKEEQIATRTEQTSIKEELNLMRIENEKRHHEIITRFETLEADHKHTWEKAVRNEREIAKIKKQF